MTAPPTTPFADGRDQRGRFAKGNAGGPGNPHAAQVARLRAALLNAITEDDIRALRRAAARAGPRGRAASDQGGARPYARTPRGGGLARAPGTARGTARAGRAIVSLRGRLIALHRELERSGMTAADRCPHCGGGSDAAHSSPRLHLGYEPPANCQRCGGAVDERGRGFAKTWRWIKFEEQPQQPPVDG